MQFKDGCDFKKVGSIKGIDNLTAFHLLNENFSIQHTVSNIQAKTSETVAYLA